MNKKKAIPLLVASIVLLSNSTIITTAAEEDNRLINLSNDYLSCVIDQDSDSLEYLRFGLGTKLGNVKNKNDDDRSLLYKNFFTGYTSVNVGGNTYVYGTGKDTTEPFVYADNKHISSQNFDGIEIRQELTFAKGLTDFYDDMLKVSYTITNTGEDIQTGIRVMLDPMLDNDDTFVLNAEGSKHINESNFNTSVPKIWSIESNKNSEIQAYGKLNDECLPDIMLYANWGNLYNNRWDYKTTADQAVDDGALAFYWEPKLVKNGESLTYSFYYGVNNTIKTEESNYNNSAEDFTSGSSILEKSSVVKEEKSSDLSKENTEPTKKISMTENDMNILSTGYVFPIVLVVIAVASAFIVYIFAVRREKRHEK